MSGRTQGKTPATQTMRGSVHKAADKWF